MKSIFLLIAGFFFYSMLFGQTKKYSELPTNSISPTGGYIPIVIGGATKKQSADDFQFTSKLSDDIIGDSTSHSKYPSVNAMKNFVLANKTSTTYQMQSVEYVINHTNGTGDNYNGFDDIATGNISVYTNGSGNMILTPSAYRWQSFNYDAVYVNCLVNTNIVDADLATGFNPINVYVTKIYKDNSGTHNDHLTDWSFLKISSGFSSDSTCPNSSALNDPIRIGDVGTHYAFTGNGGVTNQSIGIRNGVKTYFIPGVYIPANAATKTYRFKFTIYYQ